MEYGLHGTVGRILSILWASSYSHTLCNMSLTGITRKTKFDKHFITQVFAFENTCKYAVRLGKCSRWLIAFCSVRWTML